MSNVTALSFVTRNRPTGSGFNYWNVAASGSYAADCEMGRQLAAEYLAFLRCYPTNGNAALLQCIVASMIDQAHDQPATFSRGAMVGFMQAVNGAAMAALFPTPAEAA
jgi:hypothetical protein